MTNQGEYAGLLSRLSLTPLEDRTCPVAVWATSGDLYTSNVHVGSVFPGWTGGLSTAAVELPGQNSGGTDGGLGLYEVAVGAGPGGGPRVVVGNTPTTVEGSLGGRRDFFAFESTFTGGVTVALGDVTGDGVADLVVGTGIGGGPRVEVFDGSSGALVSNFFAYESSFRGGINVAVENGDILVGSGVGGGPVVGTFDAHGNRLSTFLAGPLDARSGVQVAAGDTNLTGTDQVFTLVGSTLGAWNPDGTAVGSTTINLAGPLSLGVNSFGNALMPRPDVAGTDPTSGDTTLDEWDFTAVTLLGPRLVDAADLTTLYPSAGGTLQLGSVSQVDGVARWDLNGGLLNLTATTLSGSNPLSGPLDPAPGGAAVGPQISQQAGTLTGYVEGSDGTVYGLTNEHVVVPEGTGPAGAVGSVQVQPGPYFDGPYRELGTVSKLGDLSQSVDAALIKLGDQTDYDTRSAYVKPDGSLGHFQAHGESTAHVGQLVYAVGLFGLVEGVVVATDATAQISGEPGIPASGSTTFTGQIVVAGVDFGLPWIIAGDSGSLVVDTSGTRLALAFAGGGGIGIAQPIQTVTNSLGVTFLGG